MPKENRIYAVIDTNVFVSALLSRNGISNPAIVLNNIYSGTIIPLYSKEILEEYREVLSRPKFAVITETDVEDLISAIQYFGINAERAQVTNEIFPDPDDIVFYEVKMSVEDSYLVTGNIKHFPSNPFVVTPTQMVEIINKML